MKELLIHKRNACIVVLGDIGRSPRMSYHAQSLLEENFNVDIVSYMESKPLETLLSKPTQCKIHELTPVPVTNLTPKLKLIFKTIWQTLSLMIALISIRRPQFVLVQNPPGIPTLAVCYLYCVLMRSKFIIDWHNYTYTVLAMGMAGEGGRGGKQSFICRLAHRIEAYFGRKAHAHLCVTKAMKEDLENNWNIRPVTVLYDRPPMQFQSIDLAKKHEIYMKLSKDYPQFMPSNYADLKESGVVESTAFTQKLSSGQVLYKKRRMGILVSSTSWTPDEDFGILLKALEEYDKKAAEAPNLYPALLCIITGKGPQKAEYEEKISQLEWQKVAIILPWLEAEDYPLVLASADLGVCLHWSSSGLDLPMKVVDMFGCGLPVCAHNFNCLAELVQHGQNGFVFEDFRELAEQLQFWFEAFPDSINSTTLTQQTFRDNLRKFQALRWHENWRTHALPVFTSFI